MITSVRLRHIHASVSRWRENMLPDSAAVVTFTETAAAEAFLAGARADTFVMQQLRCLLNDIDAGFQVCWHDDRAVVKELSRQLWLRRLIALHETPERTQVGPRRRRDEPPSPSPPEKALQKKLVILRLDHHFAPASESLSVIYECKGLFSEPVKVEITSALHSAGPIYTRDLSPGETTDGVHTFAWDGKANCTAGGLKDRYIHPLYSPYKVRIYHDGTHTDAREFRVLYHSLKVVKGPWTVDEQEPPETDEKDWVQYKLNQLGYHGGPVGKDIDDYLKRAIIRYKANHKDLHELDYSQYSDTITAALKASLKAGDNPRRFMDDATLDDPSRQSKILVEALTYQGDEFELGKGTIEADRINRPLIPLEAKIYLRSKRDAAVLAPEAVGPVRVNWRFVDRNEKLSRQYSQLNTLNRSRAKRYIRKCLKLQGGRAKHGDNCHKAYGGIRDVPAENYATAWLLGDFYEPYDVQKDAGQKVVFSRACVDRATYPARLGRAGVYFRPSSIAGDDYKITAELDFTGAANKAALESDHAVTDVDRRIHATTGTFRIHRFNRVAVLIHWPARTGSGEWDEIQGEYDKAFLDVDVGSFVTKKMSEVVTKAEYQALVAANTSHAAADIDLFDDAICGVPIPAQANETAAAYKERVKLYTVDDYWMPIHRELGELLSAKLRRQYPSGFILVNVLLHRPRRIQNHPPIDLGVTPANASFVTWGFSVGLPDSVIFIDQKDPDRIYFVVAHEMGHSFWLQHAEHTAGDVPADHDQRDHNCLMSYSDPESLRPYLRPGVFKPHLCGKCNLKLRGWDIGPLPSDSGL